MHQSPSPPKWPNLTLALTGPKRTGKSTIAAALRTELEALGYRTLEIGFADPIKDALLRIAGTWKPGYREVFETHKDREFLATGQTYRHAAQTLGTEWGRQLIHDEIWIQVAAFRRRHFLQQSQSSKPAAVILPDLRFENEADWIKAVGGEVWRIIREDEPIHFEEDLHESEQFTNVEPTVSFCWRTLPRVKPEWLSNYARAYVVDKIYNHLLATNAKFEAAFSYHAGAIDSSNGAGTS